MASGTHWEWRGFGTLSAAFKENFESLDRLFGPHSVADEYLFVPDFLVNLKFRKSTGYADGLKFKRLLNRSGELEQWKEDPTEVYDFPLSEEAWDKLSREFANVGIALPPSPQRALDRQHTLEVFRQSSSRIHVVEVVKNRAARRWRGPDGDVKVELAAISSPIEVTSVGLENWVGRESEVLDERARSALLSAKAALGIDTEDLEPLNYLQAIERWTSSDRAIRG